MAAGDLDPNGITFKIGLFDPFFARPWRDILKDRKRSVALFVGFLKNVFVAPQTVANVNKRLNGNSGSHIFTLVLIWASFLLFVVFHVLQLTFDGAWAFGWFFYLCFACIATGVRLQVRQRLGVVGSNIWEDFFASLLLYPCCALQVS